MLEAKRVAVVIPAYNEELLLPEPVSVPELDTITGDDLIAVHELLNGWSGDFSQLLEKSSLPSA